MGLTHQRKAALLWCLMGLWLFAGRGKKMHKNPQIFWSRPHVLGYYSPSFHPVFNCGSVMKFTELWETEAVIQTGQTSDVWEGFLNIHVPFSEVRWQQSAQTCGVLWALSTWFTTHGLPSFPWERMWPQIGNFSPSVTQLQHCLKHKFLQGCSYQT